MLVLDVSINKKRLIEQISIQRIDGTSGNCKYVIKKPEGYSNKVFIHKYSDGYLPLLCRCLNYIKKERKRLTDKWNTSKI